MVYVDNFYISGITFRGMRMSHLFADTNKELLQMVDKIGVQRKWIQHEGTCNEHFDIALVKRKLAIKHGAKEIGMRDYAKMIQARVKLHGIHWAEASTIKILKPRW